VRDGQLTVLYDARCRVCTRIAGRLAGLDVADRLRLVPLQRAQGDRPEVQRLRAEQDLRRALHVIDGQGDWASGGEAVVRVLEQLPATRSLARLARSPVCAPLVEPAYRLVATHRGRLAWLAGSFRPGPRTASRRAGARACR
jgi:predicted DCC family thiol-disulfide oxidoreductase YuxK